MTGKIHRLHRDTAPRKPEALERDRYKALVMQCFDDREHAEKRELLNKRAEVERKARERL